MEETVGPASTCGRELLRGWWRPIGLMVSFMIYTASVRNILDTTTYVSSTVFWFWELHTCNSYEGD
jgi:hypothetical protein